MDKYFELWMIIVRRHQNNNVANSSNFNVLDWNLKKKFLFENW
jgi:hypothetical protein